ncbi:hypothetical protein GS636_18945 [Ruegeria sp. HKCCD4884]|uniref:hypothetical protein n=1 Tax=Ruegeria sp. HKCCD4884 TaxID=2683022 RepID=UPI001491CDBE|nr:hypothetical protein [Ruegeria sp. HKCCD4884]NOD94875.1 hypothetical protein [Ruegeria sp. HKCCD4884]
MTIIRTLIFLAGWIYAISQFGFFLGVSLGWIPALLFAWIIETVLVFVLVVVVSAMPQKKASISAQPIKTDAVSTEFLSERRYFSIDGSLREARRLFKRWSPYFLTIALLCGACWLVSVVFQNEYSGACKRVFETRIELMEVQASYIGNGIDLSDLYGFSYGELVYKYGGEVADNSYRYWNVERDAIYAEQRLEWPYLCPLTHPSMVADCVRQSRGLTKGLVC